MSETVETTVSVLGSCDVRDYSGVTIAEACERHAHQWFRKYLTSDRVLLVASRGSTSWGLIAHRGEAPVILEYPKRELDTAQPGQ